MKLSIVIPVYNAEKTIELLCHSLIELYAHKFRLEIVLVNDNSQDCSDIICRKLHAEFSETITYIKLSQNFGEHKALMAGLHHATGDYCVMMDDDLQNPPEEVHKLVDEMQKGYDAVYANYKEKNDVFFRNLGSKFNDKMANIVFNKPSSLYLSSFKIINRFLIDEIIKFTGPELYIDGIILRSTDNIGSVRAIHRKREHNRSGYTFRKLVSLWGSMVVNFSMLPLRLVGMIGTVLILISFLYGIQKAYDDLSTYGKLSDFETLMSLNMFFRGLLLVAVSVLGEYVGRIYQSLGNEPQFVIRTVLSSRRNKSKINYLKDLGGRDGEKGS